MKGLIKFLVVILILLIMPFSVLAEEEETTNENENTETTEKTEDDKRVRIYFFRGEGCPHCEEAEEWFKSIEDEYGEKFVIVDYEVWYDEDNASLMSKVAEKRGEEVGGVPYIIIGDQTFNGFDSSYEDSIKSKIDEMYNKEVEDRYDIMKLLGEDVKVDPAKKTGKKSDSHTSDIIAIIVILLVVIAGVFGIIYARKNTN